MKKKLLIFVLISMAFSAQVSALWTNKTMTIGGLSRSYRVYQSPNYNSAVPASLIIALHGLGDNMTNFSGIGFNYIADTANIICIFPQAVSDPIVGTAWNSGAGVLSYYPNASVDDIGFINALIDTAKVDYAIDHSRVYLCGFSMGGFMTEKMALQSNSRIAAFGSMSGTFGSQITTFSPGRHIPIAHFHGTHDSTVYYTGNLYGMDPDSLVKFWVTNNACNLTPATYNYPDAVADSITIERFDYTNGDPQSDVSFYKMFGATHTVLFQPTNDMTEPVELWLFLRRHTYATAGIAEQKNTSNDTHIFPNPATNQLNFTCQSADISENSYISVYNLQGQLVFQQKVYQPSTQMDMSSLAKGIYFLKFKNESKSEVSRIVKE
ncbi:MAG: T9SS type A sorting domain-containing protein [Bacteroidota bacterium]